MTYGIEQPLHLFNVAISCAAVVYVLRLIRLSGRAKAWWLFSAAFVLVALDRVSELLAHANILLGGSTHELLSDVLQAAAAMCLFGGVLAIRLIFIERNAAQAESNRHVEELERNRAIIERASREWQSSFDAVADPMFMHDADFRVMRANRAYAKKAGLAYEEIVGKRYWEIFPRQGSPLPGCASGGEGKEEEVQVGSSEIYLSRAFEVREKDGGYLHSLHVMEDITERKQAERALLRTNRALRTLSAANNTLIRATDEMQLLNEMCRLAVTHGGYRMAWIGYARNDPDKTIEVMARSGLDKGFLALAGVSWDVASQCGNCLCGRAIRYGTTQIAHDALGDPCMSHLHEEFRRAGFAAGIVLSLTHEGKAFGVLGLFADKPDAFNPEEVGLLEEMAGDLAFGIQSLRIKDAHSRHEQAMLSSLQGALQAFAAMVEMRDPYTAGHQKRVAQLAAAIAQDMGLDDDQRECVYLASSVFDVGKVLLPAEILSRPRKLTGLELGYVHTHAQAGFDFLKPIPFPWPIAQIVLQHHERMDGSGYPQGLKGEQILLEARILGVSDVVEAMSSHRPYRPALGMEVALDEIAQQRGVLYDPAVADVCVSLFRNKGFAFG